MASGTNSMQVLSASSFSIVVGSKTIAMFSELQGIKSSMESILYTYSPGGTKQYVQSRQFGKVEAPDVTLKKGMEGSEAEGMLWAWHIAARNGIPVARTDCQLYLMGYAPNATDASQLSNIATYKLINAWPKSLVISPAKSGEALVTIDMVLTCDEILPDHLPSWTGA